MRDIMYVITKHGTCGTPHLEYGTMVGTCGTPHLEAWCYANIVGLSITTPGPWTSDQALAGLNHLFCKIIYASYS